MTTTPVRSLLLIPGTAVLAVALSACGADAETSAPAPVPASSAPASSAPADTASSTPSATESASSTPSAGTDDDQDDQDDLNDADDNDADDNDAVERNEVDLADQSGDGRSVRVRDVRIDKGDGFVAIYDGSKVLGSAEVGKGRTLTVKLDDRIPSTGEYRAVLFADTDKNGSFSASKDKKVTEADDDGGRDVIEDDFDYTRR